MSAPQIARAGVFFDVLEEHRDEAEFALEMFDAALRSATRNLGQLARYPERALLAHLDALVIGGDAVADSLLLKSLTEATSERPAATAVAAFCFARLGRVREILDALENVEARTGALRGLALSRDTVLLAELQQRADTPALRACALSLSATMGAPPPNCLAALQSEDLELVMAALAAVRHGDPQTYGGIVDWLSRHDVSTVRESAMVTSLAWRLPASTHACEAAALTTSSEVARGLYASLGGASEHARLCELLQSKTSVASLLFALGFTGRSDLLPVLYPYLQGDDPHEAKLALQALTMITGLDWEREGAVIEASPSAVDQLLPDVNDDAEARAALPPLDEDDLDADLIPPPELELADVQVERVVARCERFRAEADTGRLLGGVAYTPSSLGAYLKEAPMRQRPILALASSVHARGRAWLDTRALIATQREYDAALSGALPARLFALSAW
jgi:uncharacterized protein (TIGR02270 family)